ncbi:MAG: NifB/NifX family molybdenum-iron cluster-binding protein, partial [Thermodesulfobacteriota bacterium]|nr:NifB/NifX family molybdenum-iron cluster-binding protein [Thermodesulfobacteriota bacterium]
MKIALPSRDGKFDGHFGHCDYFTVFSVDTNNKIISEERVDPPAGCGCKSNIVSILSEMGVSVMLAKNMGKGAVAVLNSQGIKVYRGCS